MLKNTRTSKESDNMQDKENLLPVDDKVLHCLARIIQDGTTDEGSVKCLYCKYAHECRDRAISTGKVLFMEIIDELEKRTSVRIYFKQEEPLRGSWIEKYPDLLERFKGMTFEEQKNALCTEDFSRYSGKTAK